MPTVTQVLGPMIRLTETEFCIVRPRDFYETPGLRALVAWCDEHGVPARQMPAETPIVRDVDAMTISFDKLVLDDRGNSVRDPARGPYGMLTEHVVLQLDRAPAPWPAELVELAKPYPATTAYVVSDSPKMLRETLCVAQARIGTSPLDEGRKREHMDRLQRLIDECDRHRPLGRGGKHGDLHTPTCGCDR